MVLLGSRTSQAEPVCLSKAPRFVDQWKFHCDVEWDRTSVKHETNKAHSLVQRTGLDARPTNLAGRACVPLQGAPLCLQWKFHWQATDRTSVSHETAKDHSLVQRTSLDNFNYQHTLSDNMRKASTPIAFSSSWNWIIQHIRISCYVVLEPISERTWEIQENNIHSLPKLLEHYLCYKWASGGLHFSKHLELLQKRLEKIQKGIVKAKWSTTWCNFLCRPKSHDYIS